MRFPAPFSQTRRAPPQPDLLIGQPGFANGNAPDMGGNCSNKSLALSSSSGPQLTSLAIDSSGNLWATDPLNNRVLMYPAANLTAGAQTPVASVVLGQNDFVTCTARTNGATQLTKTIVYDPSETGFRCVGESLCSGWFFASAVFPGTDLLLSGAGGAASLGGCASAGGGKHFNYGVSHELYARHFRTRTTI